MYGLHRNNFVLLFPSNEIENELTVTPYLMYIFKLEVELLLKKLINFLSLSQTPVHRIGRLVTSVAVTVAQSKLPLERCYCVKQFTN